MRTNTNNALHIKRQIRPEDYRRDQTLTIVDKHGVRHTFPTELIRALREMKILKGPTPPMLKNQAE